MDELDRVVAVVWAGPAPVVEARQRGTAARRDGAGMPDGVGGRLGSVDGRIRETGTGADEDGGARGDVGGGSNLMLLSDLRESPVGDGRRDVVKLSSGKSKSELTEWCEL